MDLKGKVALITGGAQGIGRAIARELALAGADLALADVNLQRVEETAALLAAETGRQALAIKMDVSSPADAEEGVKKTVDKYNRLDILVNNAGVTRDGLIMRMNEADWDLVIAINLKGTFNCIKAVTRVMLKQRAGRIVNIASVVGLMGNAGQANYSASKAGVIGLTKTTAKELASRGITVNAVAPGFIKTAMTEALSEEARQNLQRLIPLGRLGEAEDVAKAVAFLASDEAAYITGQVLARGRRDGDVTMPLAASHSRVNVRGYSRGNIHFIQQGGESSVALEDKVKEIIVDQLGVDADEVTTEASFIDDLGADSLDTVELVMALEEEFNMEIPDEEAEKIKTVGDAIEYIKSHANVAQS